MPDWQTLAAIATIVATLLAVLGALVATVRFFRNRSKEIEQRRQAEREERKNRKKISIELTDELQEKNLTYGVRHVRNGTGDDPETLINSDHYMEEENDKEYSATVEYIERLGFQFKCFAEYDNNRFEEIQGLLEEAGFKSISPSSVDAQKAWFLLPDEYGYGEVRTHDGFVDNYYYP